MQVLGALYQSTNLLISPYGRDSTGRRRLHQSNSEAQAPLGLGPELYSPTLKYIPQDSPELYGGYLEYNTSSLGTVVVE